METQKSLKTNKRYVGYTSKDPELRLAEHNAGMTKSTSKQRPFKLIHQELFEQKNEAIRRELFLKSGQGRKFLDQIIPA